MSKRWFNNHRRDPWRRQAKSGGYRARSAYKLLQIQKRFELIRPSDTVLDVGCHPGGWTQVAVEVAGPEGVVIGVDLEPCTPLEGAKMLVGDITTIECQNKILNLLDGKKFNSIVSDISPSLTGQYDMDQAISIDLVCMVMDFTLPHLATGGSFVTKIFQGRGIEAVVEAAKSRFSKVQRFSPEASRNSSSETFLVCKNRLPEKRFKERASISDQVSKWLESAGFVVDEDEPEPAGKVGFTLHRASDSEE